ncbi:GerMN domain-containing protein [Arthrobacter sp. MDT2-16]
MSEHDPLKKSRLGLRGILLASGSVLVASSVFVLPNTGLLPGTAPTASITGPLTAATGTPTDPSSDATIESRDATAGAAAAPALLPVYWVADVDGSGRLFREFLPTPQESSGDPIADAVRLMSAGEPLDPDYRSPWQDASSVRSAISTKNVITLDISSDAFGGSLGEDDARLALQQLVYTATAAASNAGLIPGGESSSVVVLVDGASGFRAFDSVDLTGEWTRDTATLAPVWIIDPQQDVEADTAGLIVHGVGPSSEESVDWRIDRQVDGLGDGSGDAELFRDGSVDIMPGDGAYSFSVTLPPGRYAITVSVPAGDGEAQDSKTVVVR